VPWKSLKTQRNWMKRCALKSKSSAANSKQGRKEYGKAERPEISRQVAKPPSWAVPLAPLREPIHMRDSVCALVSGGLDSCVMLAELARGRSCHPERSERSPVICPVFIRQGLIWEETELHHLRRFLRALAASSLTTHYSPLTVLDLPVPRFVRQPLEHHRTRRSR